MNTPSVKKQLMGDAVIIAAFGLLAWGIYALGSSLADDIRLLRTEGVAIQAEVVKLNGGSPPQVTIRYHIDGVAYTAHEKTHRPPPAAGSTVWGFYHPDNPERVRLRDLDEDTIHEDMEPFRLLPTLFLAPLLILVAARIARLRKKDPFVAVGPVLALVFLAVIVGVNFDPNVQEQLNRRLGEQVLGLPTHVFFGAMEVVVVGPLLFLFSSAIMQMQALSIASGSGIQRAGIILWAIRNPAAKEQPDVRLRFLVSSFLLLALLITLGVWLTVTE